MTTLITIPTYNRKKLLPRAIDSVFAQTDPDWFLFVVDDGSTDGTWEYLKTFEGEERFQAFGRDENRGLVEIFNGMLGTAVLSDHKYWSWLASDDELRPDFVETHKYYMKRTGTDVTYSDYMSMTGNKKRYVNLYIDSLMIPVTMKKRVCISLASICVKIEVLREIKERFGFFCDPRFRHMNDWDFLLKLTQVTDQFQHISRALTTYHIHPEMGSSGIYFPTAPQSEIAKQFLKERASMKR